jgi:hypothetical protein
MTLAEALNAREAVFRSVDCNYCGATPGERCVSWPGPTTKAKVHLLRRERAQRERKAEIVAAVGPYLAEIHR